MYIPIECSPNDQIPPNINSTKIYISSDKEVCIEQLDIHGASIQYIPIFMMM
jgi:hypothetical protein